MSEEMPTKEAIESYEKIAEENIKDSRSDEVFGKAYRKAVGQVARILAATLPPVLLTACAACEKPPVVEEQQEEEKPVVEVPSETKEETKKETPPVVEETPEEIEWEGVVIPSIEGLRFEEGTFYAKKDNPYGLKEGEKVGVCVKDAVEINGVMESSIGLRPEVIEAMQKKIMEEEKEFRYAFPIDLEQAKGIKIKEVAFTWLDDAYKSKDVFWDNNSYLEISNIPVGTKIYSPVSTTYYLIWDNNLGRNDPSEPSNYTLDFGLFTSGTYKEDILFKNERVDVIDLGIGTAGVNLLPSDIEKNITEKDGGHSFLTETKIGEPIAEVVSEEYRLIKIDCFIYQLKNKNDKVEIYNIGVSSLLKAADLGSAGLLKIGDVPVFISP
jgi:hypothetical protein